MGRYANRLREGRFNIDGQAYQVTRNNHGQHLHGGVQAMHAKVWSAEVLDLPCASAVRFTHVSPAGDVARPTTVAPVVVVARDVDCSWLDLSGVGARVVVSDSPAVANIVLVDCPDPDTQAEDGAAAGNARPSDANRNRDLLEQIGRAHV